MSEKHMPKAIRRFRTWWREYPPGFRVYAGHNISAIALSLYQAWLPKGSFHTTRDASGDFYVVKGKKPSIGRPPTKEGCRLDSTKPIGERHDR